MGRAETFKIKHVNTDLSTTVPIQEKLRKWCTKFNPSRECINSLLHIPAEEKIDVQRYQKSLKKAYEKILVRTLAPGVYRQYSIENQLQKITVILHEFDEVVPDISIDGQPLYQSSRLRLYPILAKIVNIPHIKVCLIGAFVDGKIRHALTIIYLIS